MNTAQPQPDDAVGRHPWWSIDGAELLRVLRLAHAGADPDMLYAEMYANAHVTPPRPDRPVDGQ